MRHRPILWLLAAILAAPWLAQVNAWIVDLLYQFGLPGRDAVALVAVVLIVVLIFKER